MLCGKLDQKQALPRKYLVRLYVAPLQHRQLQRVWARLVKCPTISTCLSWCAWSIAFMYVIVYTCSKLECELVKKQDKERISIFGMTYKPGILCRNAHSCDVVTKASLRNPGRLGNREIRRPNVLPAWGKTTDQSGRNSKHTSPSCKPLSDGDFLDVKTDFKCDSLRYQSNKHGKSDSSGPLHVIDALHLLAALSK